MRLTLRTCALIACTGAFALTAAAQQKPAAKAPAHTVANSAKLGPGEYATFVTSKGTFVVQLFPKEAPKAVANFVGLAEGKHAYKDPVTDSLSMHKLYEGLLFFRSVPDYMIQTGDPLNNGTGKLGYNIAYEKNNLKFDQPGRMALAQIPGDDTSRGSQVFFTLKPVPAFDKEGFLIIGQIVQGLDVADALSQGPRKGGASDIPEFPNILQHVTIQNVP